MRGQILVELLIAIAILAVIAALGAQLVNVSLQASETSKETGRELRMAQEAMEAMRAIAYGNDASSQGWNRVYKPPDGTGDSSLSKGAGNPYHPVLTGGNPFFWQLAAGEETIGLDGTDYIRRVIIDNVSRDTSGLIEPTYTVSRDDSATQKITATIIGPLGREVSLSGYLTRFFNESSPQSDWMAGLGCGPVDAGSGSNFYCFSQCIRRLPGKFDLQPGC